jgi:site-specific recombinase XerD
VSEALAVTADHATLAGDSTLKVVNPKGGRERLVPLHPELALAISTAGGIVKPGQALVGMNRLKAWRRIKACAKRANIKSPELVGVHTLRHSAARHWLSQGIEINRVQLWLGHRNMATTLRYLALTPDAAGDMQRVE